MEGSIISENQFATLCCRTAWFGHRQRCSLACASEEYWLCPWDPTNFQTAPFIACAFDATNGAGPRKRRITSCRVFDRSERLLRSLALRTLPTSCALPVVASASCYGSGLSLFWWCFSVWR